MRRIFFLSITVLLIELFSYVGAKGVFWFIRPFFSHAKTAVLIGVFVISHLFLAALLFGQFRLGMGYMAVLWFVVMMSLAMCLVIGALKLANITPNALLVRLLAVVGFVGLVGVSVYNAYTPVVRHLSIQVDKAINPVRVAMASDTHLGHFMGTNQLNQLADILQKEQADVLLMPGDIMDDDTHAYHDQNMGAAFSRLVGAVHGNAIASLGNHDLYQPTQRQAIVQAIRDSKAILLDDKSTTLTINGTPITVIGRFDDHHTARKSTAELMTDVDNRHLVVLLDHRPSQIDENVKLPIDLQVSGHTHNGQIFPANLIVKFLNRVAYGHKLINGTHVVVSSGYGFWGIPFRLGSQAEVWIIDITGTHP